MVRAVETFCCSHPDSELIILVIMSHGDNLGDIKCHDESICKIQDLLSILPENEEQARVSVGMIFKEFL